MTANSTTFEDNVAPVHNPNVLTNEKIDAFFVEPNKIEPKIPTWEFEGKEYPLFVANGEDTVAIELKQDGKVIGILAATFRWEKSEPFQEHLNVEFKEVRNTRENEVESQVKNLTRQNVGLFKALCVGGELVKLIDGDEIKEPKNRDEMLRLPQEIQSDLIDKWISHFYIDRYFKDGRTALDDLFGRPESVEYVCRLGSRKDPSHVMIPEYDLPSDDARRDYEDTVTQRSRKRDGEEEIATVTVNNNRKIRDGRKYLRGIQGAGVEIEGQIVPVDSDETLKLFRQKFNPEWLIRLCDTLYDTFDIAGK